MTLWHPAYIPDLSSVFSARHSASGILGIQDDMLDSFSLKECRVPMPLLFEEMPDNTVTLLLRVQDAVCGKLAWESESPDPRPHSS